MGLMKPRVSSYVDRGNELIAKGKDQAGNEPGEPRSAVLLREGYRQHISIR